MGNRAYIVIKTDDNAVSEVYAHEMDFDAREHMHRMAIDNLVDYGYDPKDDAEATEILYNMGGCWEEDIIDFGDCAGPVFQLFDCAVLPRS